MIKCYYCKDLKYHTEGFQFEPLVMTESECNPGYFLPDSELEQLAKECFEAGADAYRDYSNFGERKDFATFWTERKEKVKDEKN